MTTEEIKRFCKEYNIDNYTINDDMTIDVVGDVDFRWVRSKKIPLRFGTVTGCFLCNNAGLTSLDGAPHTVNGPWNGGAFSPGNFWCSSNYLTSLEGGPQNITGYYFAEYNPLTTLNGEPTTCKYLRMVEGLYDALKSKTRIDTINELLS